MKPRLLDLCTGKGGWAKGFEAEGWLVVAVDIEDFSNDCPGIFIQADILIWEGWRQLRGIKAVAASPPCDQFSRFAMPWTRARNPPEPDLNLINRCRFIAKQLGVPIILENVRAAQKWLGRSVMNCGPFHLWDDVPVLIPTFHGRKKESYGSKQKSERAVIPEHLARHVARTLRLSRINSTPSVP